jgi:hypothetical protein
MRLELKHVAPYSPYGLKYICVKGDFKGEVGIIYAGSITSLLGKTDHKPILRLLSDHEIRLVKYEFHSLGLDTVFNWGNILLILRKGQYSLLPQSLFDVILSNHVDVFSLIENGLAIDINTLNS